MKKKDTRQRFQFRFWLDVAKDECYDLAVKLEELKQKRKFAPTIRNALRLFFDLKAGKTDILSELFPGVVAELKSRQDSHEVRQFEAILEKHHSELLATINASENVPKKMDVPTVRTPDFNDLGSDDLVLKKDTSTDCGQNFLKSMMALQG